MSDRVAIVFGGPHGIGSKPKRANQGVFQRGARKVVNVTASRPSVSALVNASLISALPIPCSKDEGSTEMFVSRHGVPVPIGKASDCCAFIRRVKLRC